MMSVSLLFHSLLHPFLQAPDGVVVVGVLVSPERPGLVAGGGSRVGHGSLHGLGPITGSDAVIGHN